MSYVELAARCVADALAVSFTLPDAQHESSNVARNITGLMLSVR